MCQIKEEWSKMIEDKIILKALIIPVIIAVVFCYIFGNNQILEANLCVIDLDNSNYSRQLIDKLDASPYMKVSRAVNTPVEPDLILADDYYKAVISIPKGLEQNIYNNIQSNIGFIVDNTIIAGTSNLRQAIIEVIGSENALLGVSKLKSRGLSTAQASGLISNLSVQQRLLFNPTGDFINTNVFGFLNLFLLFLILSSTARIIPTLRMENALDDCKKNYVALISRLLPYSVLFMISSILSLGILKQFGSLRFAGSFMEFLLPLFLYTFTTGMLGMLASWTAPDPKHIGGRLIGIVFPSFMLSNIIFPTDLMPAPIQLFSLCLPLNWYAKFFRAIGLRGVSIINISDFIGGFFLLTSIILAALYFVIQRSGKETDYTEKKNETRISKSNGNKGKDPECVL